MGAAGAVRERDGGGQEDGVQSTGEKNEIKETDTVFPGHMSSLYLCKNKCKYTV